VKGLFAAAALLAVLLGAIFAYSWGSSGSGAIFHTAGVVTMLAGLAALAGVLVKAVAGLRRTGKHRRSGLAADLDSGPRYTDNFGREREYEGSPAPRGYREPAARTDTPAGW